MKTKKHNWKRWLPLYLMMAPGLIYIFINNYIPMFGTIIAFKHINYQKGIMGRTEKFQIFVCHKRCLGNYKEYVIV